jgi:hypothetical protein
MHVKPGRADWLSASRSPLRLETVLRSLCLQYYGTTIKHSQTSYIIAHRVKKWKWGPTWGPDLKGSGMNYITSHDCVSYVDTVI